MQVDGDYQKAGYAHLRRLVAPEVSEALLGLFWRELHGGKLPVTFGQPAILTKPAFELHGSGAPAITTFLWGLTPAIAGLTGCDLLPSYAYFRLYQAGHRLLVHADRAACEHSLTLTLGTSDGLPWGFEVGRGEAQGGGASDDFGDEPCSTIMMTPGDAVLYRGIARRHGRLSPNPNKWSAHLFLHWVDRAGPYRDHAFENWPDAPAIASDG